MWDRECIISHVRDCRAESAVVKPMILSRLQTQNAEVSFDSDSHVLIRWRDLYERRTVPAVSEISQVHTQFKIQSNNCKPWKKTFKMNAT